MAYKTILVHVAPGADGRIRLAARLARACGAHLVGAAATGISRFTPPAVLDANAAYAARCTALRQHAAQALADFERLAAEEGVASIESRLVEDEADTGLALQARYCDLVVAGQADRSVAAPPLPDDLPEYLLLTSGRPILLVPADSLAHGLDGDALVAWDGSIEAVRAVTAALPLLRMARRTAVLGFGDEFVQAGTSAKDCADMAAYLGRQGIAAHCMARALGGDTGEAMLSAAADAGAGLLVMGGYGHARWRELLLGGVTATILRDMTLPVLLAH